ncbi:hypothetical protein [Candidatus Uabimicrobium sp. HlEnr_7]|uniref:hypothetical protein n=1 Tax=Candidatus Uabimicrobium helgolandensis TaxID=3095367 RepID=UPI003556D220
MVKIFFVLLLYILFCGGCSNTCKPKQKPTTTPSHFYKSNKNWLYYVERTTQLVKDKKYPQAQQIILSIVGVKQEDTNNLEIIRNKDFTNIKLDDDKQQQITEVWKDVIDLREKFLYSAAVIADLRNQWQESTQECVITKQQQLITNKLEQLPSILSLEKKIYTCDAIYDACLQLSLQNIDIINPYIDK